MAEEKKEELPHEDFAKQFRLDKLTSSVYGTDNPPKNFADAMMLLPHETIRREMDALQMSVKKLVSRIEDKSYQGGQAYQSWQAIYFCEWYIDIFEPFVHLHHDFEEDVFFPWLAEKADVPSKRYSQSHAELIAMMEGIGVTCATIVNEKGENCEVDIRDLAQQIDEFVPEMKGE